MKYYIIIFFVIFFYIILTKNIEHFFNPNYSTNIYAIRPPYQMAKLYNPEKLSPYKILKYNFLNHPIEG